MVPAHTVRCGGHITLLFSIDKSGRLKRNQGSRGAGFSIQHGVEISGSIRNDPECQPSTLMRGIQPDPHPVDKNPLPSSVSIIDRHGQPFMGQSLYLDYIDACRHATLVKPWESFDLHVNLECPTSQGFGMSAAGLMAMGRLLHLLTQRGTPIQFAKIAHRIEREHGAGLGDVLGMSVGGIELRLEPGAPGWPGHAVSFHADAPLLLVWNDAETRHTSTYIDDPKWQESITKAGEAAVKKLREGTWNAEKWPVLLEQSREFAQSSGMLEEPTRHHVYHSVLNSIVELGMQVKVAVRLCMLGNSVVVLPRRLEEPVTPEEFTRLAQDIQRSGLDTSLTSFASLTHQLEDGTGQ